MTEAAAAHVRKALDKRGKGEGLRLGVRTSGCSGKAYVLEFVDAIQTDEIVFESHGVKLIGGPEEPAVPGRHGSGLHREGLNEGFKFDNPNVKGECGCGESFTV